MLRIRNLNDDEILARLGKADKELLLDCLLHLARRHPANARVVESLLEQVDRENEAGLTPCNGLPVGGPGMPEDELLHLQVDSLLQDRAPIPAEGLARFTDELLELLDRISSPELDDEDAVELALQVLNSADNLRHRSGDNWPELSRRYYQQATELLSGLLRRSGDDDLRRDVLLTQISKCVFPGEENYEALALELLDEAQIRLLIGDLSSQPAGRGGIVDRYVLNTSAAMLARGIGDAILFEELTLEAGDASDEGCGQDEPPDGLSLLPQTSIMEVAEVYLECGRPRAALSRMKLMYEASAYRSDDSEALLTRIKQAVQSRGK